MFVEGAQIQLMMTQKILFYVTAVWFGTIIDVWTLWSNPNLNWFCHSCYQSRYAVTDDLTTYVYTHVVSECLYHRGTYMYDHKNTLKVK